MDLLDFMGKWAKPTLGATVIDRVEIRGDYLGAPRGSFRSATCNRNPSRGGTGKSASAMWRVLEAASAPEQMRRALLYFVPGLTEVQRQDAIDLGLTRDDAARLLAEGWPAPETVGMLRALRGPQPEVWSVFERHLQWQLGVYMGSGTWLTGSRPRI